MLSAGQKRSDFSSMVCPLRVFIVLISAVVAIGFLAYSMYEEDETNPDKNWLKSALDGSYLQTKYRFIMSKITGKSTKPQESQPWSTAKKLGVAAAVLACHVALFVYFEFTPSVLAPFLQAFAADSETRPL